MFKKSRQRLARCLRAVARRFDVPGATPRTRTALAIFDFYDCLVRLGFSPKHIVDVGANRGHWTQTAMRYFPDAHYTLFEPQGHLLKGCALDGLPNVRIFPMGAGPKTSTMKLSKHARDDSFSFALTQEEAAKQGREQVDVPVVALDEFLRDEGLPCPDILKIDAEGWDLEVLRGAEKTAAHADVVLMEAAVGNKLFTNSVNRVVAEMLQRGFILFDITDLNRSEQHGALWLLELAFVKKGGALDAAICPNS